MGLVTVQAAGGPHALGLAQGEAFAGGIRRTLDFYARLSRANVDGMKGAEARALAYLEVTRQALPDVIAEIEGIAEGASIELEEAWLINCIEELTGAEACTTMTSGPYLLHAEQWYAGHADTGVVIGHPDDAPAFVSPVSVGALPAVGMSSAGLAFGIDSLTGTDDRVGIARVPVSRLGLRSRSVEEGIRLATIDGRAGGYAHTIASIDRTVVVETSATEAHVFEGAPAHTNHYLAPELSALAMPASPGSRARLDQARRLLDIAPPVSLEDCARLLSDHAAGLEDGASGAGAICVHELGLDADATVFAMACDLRTGTMIVSDGSPCEGQWEEFKLPDFDSRRMQRAG